MSHVGDQVWWAFVGFFCLNGALNGDPNPTTFAAVLVGLFCSATRFVESVFCQRRQAAPRRLEEGS